MHGACAIEQHDAEAIIKSAHTYVNTHTHMRTADGIDLTSMANNQHFYLIVTIEFIFHAVFLISTKQC